VKALNFSEHNNTMSGTLEILQIKHIINNYYMKCRNHINNYDRFVQFIILQIVSQLYLFISG